MSVAEPLELIRGQVVFEGDTTTAGSLTLHGGELTLSGSPLDAPIVLANDGGSPLLRGTTFEVRGTPLRGGVTGSGDLLLAGGFTVDNLPLSQDGALRITDPTNSGGGSVTLDIANGYTGKTIVEVGRLIVNHVGSLGSDTSPVEVKGQGTLVLNASSTRDLRVDGILPWVLAQNHSVFGARGIGFGTLSDNGTITTLADYVTDINTAAANDHVEIGSTNLILNADLQIASLTFDIPGGPLDLGGHTLNLASGGLFLGEGGVIQNGSLTGGESGKNEIVVWGSGHISADITDNSRGPVSITFASGTSKEISGSNTYSGTTHVAETHLIVATANALPVNSDLHIVGGKVQLPVGQTTPTVLRAIRVAEGGKLEVQQQGRNELQFDSMLLEEGTVHLDRLIGDGSITKTTSGAASLILGSPTPTYNGTITIEDGRLEVFGGNNARFMVNGGKLVTWDTSSTIALAGGDLQTRGLHGSVEITAPARLLLDLDPNSMSSVIDGTLVGDGSLTITRAVPVSTSELASRHVHSITGDNSAFSGDVNIASVAIMARTSTALGTGHINVLPDGVLSFWGPGGDTAADRLAIQNNISLAGGQLVGDSNAPPQFLHGELHVSGMSRIGNVQVLGDTYLSDGSRLSSVTKDVTQYVGDLWIGGHAELEYGNEIIAVNASDVLVGTTQLLGTIRSNATNAVLDLIDRGLDEAVIDVSLDVQSGQSLSILHNGQSMDLLIAGGGKRVSGDGTINNNVTVSEGAAITPGSSEGLLAIDGTVSFANGGRLSIELGGVDPGIQFGALQVLGNVSLNGGLLDVTLSDGFAIQPDDTFEILTGMRIDGQFANATDSVVAGQFEFTVQYLPTSIVLGDARIVPESS
ncbi:MAG: hypothetical protein KDA99_05335, partial [Planctomycetales bacterium]|nr:hypothetical protein [Planctomycetales bacterium]